MSEHNFARTTCACTECTRCCKRQPGPLVPGDFERIARHLQETPEQAQRHFWASPGAIVRVSDGVTEPKAIRVGTVTPRRRHGRCVFLDEHDRCSVHPVAPFGCAMFDTHMSGATAQPRSVWMVRQQMQPAYQAWRNTLPYATSYKPNHY